MSEARERTDALAQAIGGSETNRMGIARLLASEIRQGTPQELGMSREEWLNEVDGGRLRYSIAPDPETRAEVVAELTAPVEEEGEGLSNRAAADVLGVAESTVRNDLADDAQNRAPDDGDPMPEAESGEAPAQNRAPDDQVIDAVVEEGEADRALQRKRGEKLLAKFQVAVAELNADRELVADAVIHGDRAKHEETINRCTDMLDELRRAMVERSKIRKVA